LKPLGRKPQASRLTVLGESVLFLDSGRFQDGSTPKLNGPHSIPHRSSKNEGILASICGFLGQKGHK
jgi:hypothetical protein